VAVGSNFLVAEEVRGGDLPDLAPVLAVGGEGDVCGAVEEDVGDGGRGPGSEHVVMCAQDSLSSARRGDDEGWHGAETDEHEPVPAVLGGEVTEGDVREGADEVQVADDGELARRRWQFAQELLSACSC
jgi:hypothetical protein